MPLFWDPGLNADFKLALGQNLNMNFQIKKKSGITVSYFIISNFFKRRNLCKINERTRIP